MTTFPSLKDPQHASLARSDEMGRSNQGEVDPQISCSHTMWDLKGYNQHLDFVSISKLVTNAARIAKL